MNFASAKSWGFALTCTSILVLSFPARAADPAPPAEAPKASARPPQSNADRYQAMREQREVWMKELGVSDEQREKLRAALKEQSDSMAKIRADTTLDNAAKSEKIKGLRDGLAAKYKQILTPEQFAKYEKLQEQRREQMNSRIERKKPQDGEAQPKAAKPATDKPAPAPAPAEKTQK